MVIWYKRSHRSCNPLILKNSIMSTEVETSHWVSTSNGIVTVSVANWWNVPDSRASIFEKNRISGTYLKNKFQELEEFLIEALRAWGPPKAGQAVHRIRKLIRRWHLELVERSTKYTYRRTKVRGLQKLGTCLI